MLSILQKGKSTCNIQAGKSKNIYRPIFFFPEPLTWIDEARSLLTMGPRGWRNAWSLVDPIPSIKGMFWWHDVSRQVPPFVTSSHKVTLSSSKLKDSHKQRQFRFQPVGCLRSGCLLWNSSFLYFEKLYSLCMCFLFPARGQRFYSETPPKKGRPLSLLSNLRVVRMITKNPTRVISY